MSFEVWLPHIITILILGISYLVSNAKRSTTFDLKIEALTKLYNEMKTDIKELVKEFGTHKEQAAVIQQKIEQVEEKLERINDDKETRNKDQARWRTW